MMQTAGKVCIAGTPLSLQTMAQQMQNSRQQAGKATYLTQDSELLGVGLSKVAGRDLLGVRG